MLGNPALIAAGQGAMSLAQGFLSSKAEKDKLKAEEKALKAQIAAEQKAARLAAKQAQAELDAKTSRTRTIAITSGVVLAVGVLGFVVWKMTRK